MMASFRYRLSSSKTVKITCIVKEKFNPNLNTINITFSYQPFFLLPFFPLLTFEHRTSIVLLFLYRIYVSKITAPIFIPLHQGMNNVLIDISGRPRIVSSHERVFTVDLSPWNVNIIFLYPLSVISVHWIFEDWSWTIYHLPTNPSCSSSPLPSSPPSPSCVRVSSKWSDNAARI